MKNYKLSTPEGVRDYLSTDMRLKEDIQNKTKECFLSYGYSLVETPSFEYLDVFKSGNDGLQKPDSYNLVNRQGEIVTLRNDMTKSIARLVAATNNIDFPLRYCYQANIFRYPERYQGKLHEFTQSGVELIGLSTISCDIEIITLAIRTLKSIGIKDFTIHIGHSAFFKACLEELNLSAELEYQVYEAIEKRDEVKLGKILRSANMDDETLMVIIELIESIGKLDLLNDILKKIKSKKAIEALNYLKSIYEALDEQGLSEEILFDFSLMSYGSYYTGINFQAYTKGIGVAVIEGGRYDKLISTFGKDVPAVGFALYVNELIKKQLIVNYKPLNRQHIVIGFDKESRKSAYHKANELRECNNIVELSIYSTYEETKEYAKKMNASYVLYKKGKIFEEVIK